MDLLQIPVTDEELHERLVITKDFSKAARKNILLNCANLTFVLLGLVEDPKNYLGFCTTRNRGTQDSEIEDVIVGALAKAGIEYNSQNKLTEKTMDKPEDYTKTMNYFLEILSVGNATPLWFEFTNDVLHLVFLRKKDKTTLELIDSQDINRDASYPLTTKHYGIFNIQPYKKNIRKILWLKGPTLTSQQALKAKSNIDKFLMFETHGGKRKKQKTRRSKRRGLKSVRRKTIRGSSLSK